MQINEKPAEIILRNARTPRGGGGATGWACYADI